MASLQLSGKRGVLLLHEGIDKFLPYEGAFELCMNEIPRILIMLLWGIFISGIKASFGEGELAYPGSSEIISRTEIAGWQKRERASTLWILRVMALRLGMLILNVSDRRLKRS